MCYSVCISSFHAGLRQRSIFVVVVHVCLIATLASRQCMAAHRVSENRILFKKSKSGLMTFYIVPNDYIYVIWYIFDLIGCALGAQWAVDSAQWAVFLTFLFVKLGSYNFVFSLEFGFIIIFVNYLVCTGCTVGCKQCTVGVFSNFFVCKARKL